MHTLTLGYSPCPNDTYIFYALVHGKIDAGGLGFRERLEDVETLNRLALTGELDVSKVSCHALGFIRDEYCVLRSGAALGRGCGPLVVTRNLENIGDLKGKKVAMPGRYTTASLLFGLCGSAEVEPVFLPFDKIMAAVAEGDVDAGVIIHESRFTYASYGLKKMMDLGEWWENETGRPIPLGCIVARRSLGERALSGLELMLRESILYAGDNPSETNGYIRAHSQEMSDEVCAAHIALYVNQFSLELGIEGESAMEFLLSRAESSGLVPPSAKPLFIK